MTSQTQHCVDRIGEVLGLPVSLTDNDLGSLLFSPHADSLIDEVRRDSLLLRSTAPWVKDWFAEYGVGRANRPVRVLPHPHRDTMSRVVVPVQHRGRRLGLLCVLDPDHTCTDDTLARVEDLVDQLAQLLYDEDTDRAQTARQVHDLITGTAQVRARAAAELQKTIQVPPDTTWMVAAIAGIQGPPKPAGDPPASAARRAPIALQCAAASHHVVILPGDQAAAELRGIGRIAQTCCRTPIIGIGEPVPLPDAVASYGQAIAALSAAARLADLPDQVAFADLGALRHLVTRPDTDLAAGIDPQTRALLDLDDPVLIDTLTAYLDTGCDAAATAARLTVHRGTLYYRLRKAETTSGLDLSRGPGRLTLYVGLLAHRLVASPRRPAHPGPVQLLPL